MAMILITSYALAYDIQVDGVYYNVNASERTCEVTHNGDNTYSGDIIIPETLNYKNKTLIVSSIGYKAFYNCTDLKSIVIGDSVNCICEFAFYGCNNLTSITIPNSVIRIDNYAFENCDSLKELVIEDGLNTLSLGKCSFSNTFEGWTSTYTRGLFYYSPIETVYLGRNLNSEQSPFYNNLYRDGNRHIKTVIIGDSVTNIERYTFYGCDGLSTVFIGNSVSNIDEYAFSNCDNLNSMFYTSAIPPAALWLVPNTYVPNLALYSQSPVLSGNAIYMDEYVTFETKSITYGDSFNFSWSNNVNCLGYKASTSEPELSINAGSHTVEIPFTFSNDERSFDVIIPYNYTINKAVINVNVDSVSRVYGEENPEFNISYSGFVNGEDESVLTNKGITTTNATSKSDVGNYDVIVSGVTADNYEAICDTGVLNIRKAPLVVFANTLYRTYGDDNPIFTLKYEGLKNEETFPQMIRDVNITTGATKLSDVGEYEIVISGGEARNYEVTNYINGKLVVTKAPLVVTANNVGKIYGDDNPDFDYSCVGVKNGDDETAIFVTKPALTCVADKNSNVGEYNIEVSGASSVNYEISYESGILYVNKRELFVSTKNYTRIYGEENPSFEILFNGFVNNEDENVLLIKPIVKTVAEKYSDVGVYDINVDGGDDDNYSFVYTNSTLTIEKADQIITWEQDFDTLVVGEQVELTAMASSGLDIEYIVPENDIISIYTVSGTTYLDCCGYGEVVVRATQNGNKNFNAAVRVPKNVRIVPTSITDVSVDAMVEINGNAITITDSIGCVVYVHLANGVLFKKIDKYMGEEIMLGKGIYIVRVGNNAMKVSL